MSKTLNILVRIAVISLVFLGLVMSPIAALLLQSEYYRFITIQQITHKISPIFPPTWVFVGDSITAGGRTWSLKLGSGPFDSINLGADGLMIRQVAGLIPRATSYSSKHLVLMAGINDLLNDTQNDEGFLKDWEKLLISIPENKKITVIVCSVLIGKNQEHDERILLVNKELETLCLKYGIRFLDLNPAFIHFKSRESLFIDPIHLSANGYELWVDSLSKFVNTLTQ